ncbi:MAG: ferredoxin III, nif-specific [Actinobacteria bacterium HGW-Actinobacteria-1]|jgi:Nif-specific ferredoxin III|nr:MAG: ferredoxin III, nif-specific [Actinobacteria bacterium HGW-Actinobacteria-1]
MATALTRGGQEWVPSYLQSIDYEVCIGCGRCYKVCGQGVMAPIEKPFEGDDDDEDDMGNTVMSVASPDACIGCGACARACVKNAHTHVTC